MPKIIQGNLEELAPKHKDWVLGHFMEEGSPFKTNAFELKWDKLKAGEKKSSLGTQKTAKTLGILVYGKFEFGFPKDRQKIILSKEGDYCFYDAGVTHSWRILEDCLLISIRWPSLPGDQVQSGQAPFPIKQKE